MLLPTAAMLVSAIIALKASKHVGSDMAARTRRKAAQPARIGAISESA
jgi:hypothetical protein